MMIAIPVKADEVNPLNSKISKLFGKAPAILLVGENKEATILKNDFTSGQKLAQELIRLGVKTLLTDHLGEKAYEILSEANVKIKKHNLSCIADLGLKAFAENELKLFESDMTQDRKHRNKGNCDSTSSSCDSSKSHAKDGCGCDGHDKEGSNKQERSRHGRGQGHAKRGGQGRCGKH